MGTVPRLNGKNWGGEASGPAVKASGMAASKMYEVVEVGEEMANYLGHLQHGTSIVRN